jgi:hypothetical protein
LRQISDFQARHGHGLTLDFLVNAGHDLEQRGLARTVDPEHPDLGAREKGQRNVLEDVALGRHDFADPVHGKNVLGHGVCVGAKEEIWEIKRCAWHWPIVDQTLHRRKIQSVSLSQGKHSASNALKFVRTFRKQGQPAHGALHGAKHGALVAQRSSSACKMHWRSTAGRTGLCSTRTSD